MAGTTFVFRIEENPGWEGRVPAIAPAGGTSDTAAVARVVADFHAAIGRADSIAALSNAGDKCQHHGVRRRRAPERMPRVSPCGGHRLRARCATHQQGSPGDCRGDAAWVTSTSATRGSFKGRAVNSSVHTGHPGARLRALATCLRALGHPHLLARVGARAADVDISRLGRSTL